MASGSIVSIVVKSAIVAATLLGIFSVPVAVKAQDSRRPNQEIVEFNRLLEEAAYQPAAAQQAIVYAQKQLRGIEDRLGRDHIDVVIWLNCLGAAYIAPTPGGHVRFDEADRLFKRGLSIREKQFGSNHPEVADSLVHLANLYRLQPSHVQRAEELILKALSIFENSLITIHPTLASALEAMAALREVQYRYKDAAESAMKALAILEAITPPDPSAVVGALNHAAGIYHKMGRHAEAEALHRRGLILIDALAPQNPRLAYYLIELSDLYRSIRSFAFAEQLLRRTAKTPSLKYVSLSSLSDLFESQGDFGQAEGYATQALALAAIPPEYALATIRLARIKQRNGKWIEANGLFGKGLAAVTSAFSRDSEEFTSALLDVAAYQVAAGQVRDAEAALGIVEINLKRSFGSSQSAAQRQSIIRSRIALFRGEYSKAVSFLKQSIMISEARAGRGEATETERWQYEHVIKAAHRLKGKELTTLANEIFMTAQLAHTSQAGNAIALMAARASEDSELRKLVREQQDKSLERRDTDKRLLEMMVVPSTARDKTREGALQVRLGELNARLSSIDLQLKKDHPRYFDLSSMAPISFGEVQAQLKGDEVLLLFVDTQKISGKADILPEETFI